MADLQKIKKISKGIADVQTAVNLYNGMLSHFDLSTHVRK